MPLVWLSSCRMVTAAVAAASATAKSGSTSATRVSRSSRPDSTSCITSVAV
ncbi:hypothetical protein F4561_003143 [Lipingzhangella halophila]|uniref:Secreted protein n=1 Tax=Lipingzhangella halophila TaxID=1783352 RepID=A0A7W7W3B1_9ACTN|nr:hypothetical protein [Lipingzhangella halophila]